MDTAITCPNCKTVNPATNLFCQACGSKLAAAPAMPAAPAPYAPPPQAPYVPPAPAQYPPQPQAPGQPPALTYQPPAPVYVAPAISKLGVKVDEFSDFVPGLGEKAAKVEETFVNSLKEKGLPGVNVFKSAYSAGGKQRPYVAVTNPAGATLLTDFIPVGKDLSTNWALYVKRVLNWLPLAILGGVALLLPLAWSIYSIMGYVSFVFALYLAGIFAIIALGIVGFMLVGKVLKDNTWWLFIKDPDDIAWEDINTLQSIVHDALIDAVEKVELEPEPEPVAEKKPAKKK